MRQMLRSERSVQNRADHAVRRIMNRRSHRQTFDRSIFRRQLDARPGSIRLGQMQPLKGRGAEAEKYADQKNGWIAQHRQISSASARSRSSWTLAKRQPKHYPVDMATKLRWGILGTGNIATQFAKGMALSRRGALTAVGSRRQNSADEFARIHAIPRALGSYESLIADEEIDAVYNSLPNSLHADWTIRALKAGKHVLCEKPLAMNASEAEKMFDVADKAGCVLAEAFMYRSHPQTLALVETVRSGAIGQLRLIRTSFCYRTRSIDGNVRFARELGGGALMDIGCYCINFARLFAGAEPTAIHAVANFHSTGVDELAAGTLVFPNNIVSSFTCGMCLHADNTAYLCGSEGYIEVPVPWKPGPESSKFILTRGNEPKMDKPKSVAPPPREIRNIEAPGDMYQMEADDFAAAVLDGQPSRVSREDSVGNMRLLDETRRQIGLEF
jgi:xylose dehydrogenase (NAD/NADP)